MGIQGVQAGPDQIADGNDPSILATVVKGATGNLVESFQEGIDTQTGAIRPVAVDPGGKQVLSDTDKLTLMLVEMRIQTQYLAAIAGGLVMTDEPDTLRADADVSGLLTTLS